MSEIIKTVAVKTEPSEFNPEGKLLINEEDVTDEHVLFDATDETEDKKLSKAAKKAAKDAVVDAPVLPAWAPQV